MPNATPAAEPPATPYSDASAYLVEAQYRLMGCDGWDVRRVQRLMGKLGETPTILAARMRIRPSDLATRMRTDAFTKQDALILTIIEREIDFLRGGIAPKGALIAVGGAS